jgi:hypothetical protein
MSRDFGPIVRLLLRSDAPGARDVVLYLLVAQLLAAASDPGGDAPRRRPPRAVVRASRARRHESLAGRRPRG